MPPVCSNRQRRRLDSATSNRSATPGSHQTGSTAILVTETSPASWTISLSTSSRPAAIAPWISGKVSRALVIAIEGRMSMPSAISSPKSCATRWPQGSSETILPGSPHCLCGPISQTGEVS